MEYSPPAHPHSINLLIVIIDQFGDPRVLCSIDLMLNAAEIVRLY